MEKLEQTIADLIKQNKINQFEDTGKLQDKNKPLIYLPNFFSNDSNKGAILSYVEIIGLDEKEGITPTILLELPNIEVLPPYKPGFNLHIVKNFADLYGRVEKEVHNLNISGDLIVPFNDKNLTNSLKYLGYTSRVEDIAEILMNEF